jgi:C-terminal processing protease CtpA/Prc
MASSSKLWAIDDQAVRPFGEVLQRVRSYYVEKPNDAKLLEGAINGMLSALDPHSG